MKQTIALRAAGLIALFLSVAGGGIPGSFPPSPETVALFTFDEGEGTTTNDASGSGYTGFVGPRFEPAWVDGLSQKALEFKATCGFVTVAPTIPVGTEWTIQAWLRFPLLSGYQYRYVACSD